MKKLLTITLAFLLAFSLLGCSDEEKVVVVNVEDSESLDGQVFGEDAMIKIGSGLCYDSTTRIVYWWNGVFRQNHATSPSPYYAPNGLPYLYNPETNTFEEIEHG